MDDQVAPLLELTHIELVETLHYGAIAVADSGGRLLSEFGPVLPVANHRGIDVGTSTPVFRLVKAS